MNQYISEQLTPNVAVQPYSDPASLQHLEKTIKADIILEDVLSFISNTTRNVLEKEYPEGKFRLWGTKANKSLHEWEKLHKGDIILFYGGKAAGFKFIYKAQVVHTVRNAELAKFLWGNDAEGATWECIYFIKDLEKIDLDRFEYNKAMGYDRKSTIQGFRVQSPERSLILQQSFNL